MNSCPLCWDSPVFCRCSPSELGDYYLKNDSPLAKVYKEKSDQKRIKDAAVKALYDELMAILSLPPELDGECYVMLKSKLTPELRRRVQMYFKSALDGD